MANIFISRSTADRAIALEVERRLAAEGDHDVFVCDSPQGGIPVGERWETEIVEKLHRADAVVFLVTAAFTASEWCSAEVGMALYRGKAIVPVRCESDAVHPILKDIQHITVSTGPGVDRERAWAEALEHLVKRLKPRTADGRPAPNASPQSVYPGEEAFSPDQSAYLFGRHTEIDALMTQLNDGPPAVHVVVGPSGCGKSSLVQAGLLGRLRRDPRWLTLRVNVGAGDPLAALADAGVELTPQWTEAQVDHQPHAHRLLVVIDDLDRLPERAPDEVVRFAEALSGLATRATIVTTMRWTTYERLRAMAGVELPMRPYPLRPLSHEALREVIEAPAALAGIKLGPHLTPRLMEATGHGIALPLLASTLATLTREVARGNTVTVGQYENIGGLVGTVIRQARAALDATRLTQSEVVDALLLFVDADVAGRTAPRRVALARVPEPVRTVVGEFENRRLLTIDRDDDQLWVEIAHRDLLTWPPLAEVLPARAPALRAARAAEEASLEWEKAGRPRSRLWRGGQLAFARAEIGFQHAANRAWIDQTTIGFLSQSWRRDRVLHYGAIALVSILTIISLVAGGVSLWQRDVAIDLAHQAQALHRLAVSRQLLAEANAVRGLDPRLATRLSLAAAAIVPGAEARSSLLRDAVSSPITASLVEPAPILATAYSPDGRTLATAPEKHAPVLWDLTSPGHPQRKATLPMPAAEPVTAVAFSPDGHVLATGDSTGSTILWDIAAQPPRPVGAPVSVGGPGAATTVNSLTFSPDGSMLAIGDEAGNVTLWDPTKPDHPRLGPPVMTNGPAVHIVAFGPDGRALAAGDDDGLVTVWDVTKPHRPPLGEPIEAATAPIYGIAFSPDGRVLATGGEDNAVRLWDAVSAGHTRLGAALTSLSTPVWSVAFSPDGRTLGAGSDEGAVIMWDVSTLSSPPLSARLVAHTRAVLDVAFSPDGAGFVTAGEDSTAVLWDVRRLPYPHLTGPLTGHVDGVLAMAFRPDGQVLATGGEDRTVQLWDATTRPYTRLGPALTDHDETVYSMTFSPDGATLVTADDNGEVLLWDVTTPARPRLRTALTEPGGAVYSVAISPNGGTLATGNEDGTVSLFDLTRSRLPRVEGSPIGLSDTVTTVAFSPDGTTLAAGSVDNTIGLWDLTKPAHPQVGPPITAHENTVWSVAFSPDGRTLASASTDRTVRLWDVTRPEHPQLEPTLNGHTAPVQTLAFSHDGRILAAAGTDRQVILWDLTQPHRPQLGPPLAPANAAVWSVAFSPDSRVLAAGTGVGQTALIDLTTVAEERDNIVARACAIAGRGLSEQEWRAYDTSLAYPQTCSA